METPLNSKLVDNRAWSRSVRSVRNRLDDMLESGQFSINDFFSCLDLLYKLGDIVSDKLI